MKRALVLAGLCWLAMAASGQAPSPPSQDEPKKQAFDLQITAPADLQELLNQHLELQRYRELDDLSDGELDRLIESSQANVAELAATLGYFSPEIRVERRFAQGAGRLVTVGVQAGSPAKIAEVRLRFSGALADDPQALG